MATQDDLIEQAAETIERIYNGNLTLGTDLATPLRRTLAWLVGEATVGMQVHLDADQRVLDRHLAATDRLAAERDEARVDLKLAHADQREMRALLERFAGMEMCASDVGQHCPFCHWEHLDCEVPQC